MASSSSTTKVTFVGSGASAPYGARSTETTPSAPCTRSSTVPSTTTPTATAVTVPNAASSSASIPASPVSRAATAPALQTDSARLSPYVSLVRHANRASRPFGPSTTHTVRVLSRTPASGSTSGGPLSGMRTAYTPVVATASRAASRAVSGAGSPSTAGSSTTAAATMLTATATPHTPTPTPTSRIATTATPPGPTASAPTGPVAGAASGVLTKAPITHFMSDHTYVTLRDAAGRPIAAPPLDLIPPFRFATVEEGVYRGAYPVLRNFPFLKELGIRTVVSLIPEDPTYDLATFCAAEGITLHHIQAERFKGETQLLPTDLNTALNVILAVENHPIYLHCLDGRQVVGLVVMGLRKLMQWDIQSAHQEYLRFCAGASEDEVAFLTDYTGPLTVPRRVPTWLSALYTADPRSVERPRKHNCGIKLKYPVAVDDSGAAGAATDAAAAGCAASGGVTGPPAFPTTATDSAHRQGSLVGRASPTVRAEDKLSADETAIALSIHLPWSELVDAKGIYFDVAHIGHAGHQTPSGAQLPGAALNLSGGPQAPVSSHVHPTTTSVGTTSPYNPSRKNSQGSVGVGSRSRSRHSAHHRSNYSHQQTHHEGRGASTENSAYFSPPVMANVAMSGHTSKGSSANTSIALPSHLQYASTSTPPFAPAALMTHSAESTAASAGSGLAGLHLDVERSTGSLAPPSAAAVTAVVPPETCSSAASSATPLTAPLLPQPSAGVSLAYFSLGRPGGSLTPVSPPHPSHPPQQGLSNADSLGSEVSSPLRHSRQDRAQVYAGGPLSHDRASATSIAGVVDDRAVNSGSGVFARLSNHSSALLHAAGHPRVSSSTLAASHASAARHRDGHFHTAIAAVPSGTRESVIAGSKSRPKRRYSL